MPPPLSDADDALVRRLEEKSRKNKKLISSSVYSAPAAPEMQIRSWRMNEFKYYDVPSPFPTLARGIFTTWVSNTSAEEGSPDGKYRIVSRGYDKFFNIGEVPWTSWAALEKNTVPPYDLTLKSNGCIIFVSALTPSKLLVSSKHSIGPLQHIDVSHAQMGEKWLYKHLEQAGKTPEAFAEVLWENNWTVVSELCDDSFEEHVLPYSLEKTGLHLHGINESIGQFRTVPTEFLNNFAKEWGFIQTPYITLNSIEEVKSYYEDVGKSKQWNGEAIEGFVVRCHVSETAGSDRRTKPPYPAGSSFFFKLKYEEPYLMYRDWREITKSLLSAASKGQDVRTTKVPKSKLRRPESHIYVKWAREEIANDISKFDGYLHNKGIIANRDRFLRWLATQVDGQTGVEELAEQFQSVTLDEGTKEKAFGKTVIMPVAVPGCGKTSVAVALKQLLGFGHVQSDDVHARKPAPIFLKRIVEELDKHDVVIADKNNHLRQHRSELRHAVENFEPAVRILAFNWALDKSPALIHRLCADRIVVRGDNHQTLIADEKAKRHEEVIWTFLSKAEEFDDSEADEVVEMDIEEDLEQSVDRAVDACVRILGVKRPAQEEIGQALAAVRSYKPRHKNKEKVKKGSKPRYYALLPEINLQDTVGARIQGQDVPEAAKLFWEMLMQNKRVSMIPHITLVHTKSLPDQQELWDRCHELFVSQTPPTFIIELGDIVFNDRLMALTVSDIRISTDPGEDTNTEGVDFLPLIDGLKERLHITVGTSNKDVNPFEARAMVDDWKFGKNGIHSLPLKNVAVKGRIKGLSS